MTTIVLADDHRVMRQGLRLLLEEDPGFQIVGEADDGQGALQLVESLRPDVLILDMAMPDMNGASVTREAIRQSPETAVVILSMHGVEGYVRRAMQAGARAYVLKEATSDELVRAVREAIAGRRYLSQALAQRAFESFVDPDPPATMDPKLVLSEREQEILPFIVEGLTAKQISEKLHLSPRTVEFHRTNIMRSLGLRSTKELIRFSVQAGILPDEQ